MEIRLELSKDRFGARESMHGTVTIVNDGDRPIEVPDPEANSNWQPVYTIEGPSFPDGHTFSMRSAVLKDPTPSPIDVDPMTVSIGPGETYAAVLPFDNLVELTEPGEYFLTATMAWDGRTARSQTVAFRIERPSIRSCRLLASPELQDPTEILAFCLQGEGDGTEIQIASFFHDPQTDRIVQQSLSRFAPAEGKAEAVIAPWTNFTGIGTPSPRAGFQSGDTLTVIDFGEAAGQSVTLPFTPWVVHPGLTPLDAALDLFVLDADSRELGLVRFPSTIGETILRIGEPPPAVAGSDEPSLLWRHPLPGGVVTARAALSPQQGGDRRLALLALSTEDGMEVILADAGTGEQAPTVRAAQVKGLWPLSASEPAFRMDTEGRAFGSVLAASAPDEDGQRSISVVDVIWSATETDARYEATAIAGPQDPPRVSVVRYSVTPSPAPRRDWLVFTAKGEILSSWSEARSLGGSPVLPLELLSLAEFTYVLTLTDAGTLEFERLP